MSRVDLGSVLVLALVGAPFAAILCCDGLKAGLIAMAALLVSITLMAWELAS
jgi:hypothetical protein